MRSMSKTSLVMTRPIPHHPTHFLSVIGKSFARYLLLTSLNNSNPHPNYFPSYTRSIYMYNNLTKVRFISNFIVKTNS